MRLKGTIIEYKDINQLRFHSDYDKIKNKLTLCASPINSVGMNIMLEDDFTVPIINIGAVIKEMLSSWDAQETKFSQNIALGVTIEELINENSTTKLFTDLQMTILKSVNTTRDDILSSIRLMTEAKLTPEHFDLIIDDEIIVFREVWRRLEIKDNSFNEFRENVFENFNDETKLKQIFKKALEKGKEKQIKILKNFSDTYDTKVQVSLKEEDLSDVINRINEKYENLKIDIPKDIVLQGFYFITPIQKHVLYKLVDVLKINLIFLNNSENDEKNELLEIWRKSYDDTNFNGSIVEDTDDTPQSWGKIFEYMYENKSKKFINDKIKEMKTKHGFDISKIDYSSIISMKQDVDIKNRNIAYYSPYKDEINESFSNITSKNILSNLLETPLGEFIKIIHSLWYKSREANEFIIDTDLICRMFSTGWLSMVHNGKTINASNYINVFKDLEPYFSKCLNLNDFEKTVEIIKEANVNLGENLGLKNLMYNFSFFNTSEEEIEIVNKFIHNLSDIIKKLDLANPTTIKSDLIDINKHFESLKSIIETYKSTSTKGSLVETDLEILNIVEHIINHDLNVCECLAKDVFEALEIYINNKLKDENEELFNNLILELDGVEFTQILGFKEAHLCQIDQEFLPGNKSRYTWPLSENLIEVLIDKCDDEVKILLNRILLIIENRELSNKYLFYKMLQCCKNIKLVMINNLREDTVKESVYIELLLDYLEDENIYTYSSKLNEFDITNVDESGKILESEIKDNNDVISKNDYSELIKVNKEYMEAYSNANGNQGALLACAKKYFTENGQLIQLNRIYNQCKKRFYYYMMNDNKFIPYRDSYHHGFLFSLMIHVINQKIAVNESLKDDVNINSWWPEIKQIQSTKNTRSKTKSTNDIIKENFDVILNMLTRYFPQWSEVEKENLKNKALQYFGLNIHYVKELESNKEDRLTIIIPSPYSNELKIASYDENEYNKKIEFVKGIAKVSDGDKKACKYCNLKDTCMECDYDIDNK